MNPVHVLVAGMSARAAAASAARTGFQVTAIDAYADRDQHPAVRALSVTRDFGMPATAAAIARASRTIACDAVAYLSTFENHRGAVRVLASGRTLLGNGPDVLRRVRDPALLAAALRRAGLRAAALYQGGGSDTLGDRAPGAAGRAIEWLVKPRRSGGGNGIRAWTGEDVPRGSYLQERLAGTPGSVVFAAAGGAAVPLGVSRQLVGDPAFGAGGHRYCGSIMAAAGDPQFDRGSELVAAAGQLARTVAAGFALAGINGVDFIARGGQPVAIEVNPRWSASVELVETLFGIPAFAIHADACRGNVPAFDLAAASAGCAAAGKAIVYARHGTIAHDTRRWLERGWVGDVPHKGQRFEAGAPVCTVFAEAVHAADCYRLLTARAAEIHAELAAGRGLP